MYNNVRENTVYIRELPFKACITIAENSACMQKVKTLIDKMQNELD